MPVPDHPAVAAYLARFDAASAPLPAARRRALRENLVGHLTEAIPPGADRRTVRAALKRLGPPEEMVRAEQREAPPAAKRTAPVRRSVDHEERAVQLLTLGSIVPVVGWLVGAVLLWRSQHFTVREKIAGTLLVPFGPFGALYLGMGAAWLTSSTCRDTISIDSTGASTVVSDCPTGTDWTGIIAIVAVVVALVVPFVVGSVLMTRVRKRLGVPDRRPRRSSSPPQWAQTHHH